jgi:hypothetical protein
MDVWEHDNRGPALAGHSPPAGGVLGAAVLGPEARNPPDASIGAAAQGGDTDADETVFTVLAARARTHATAHLWLTAGIGGIDAAALMIGRPALWWVAAACGAVTAYAVWGLADRAAAFAGPTHRWTRVVCRGIKGLALVVGVAAALAAAIGFLGVALGKSPPTG